MNCAHNWIESDKKLTCYHIVTWNFIWKMASTMMMNSKLRWIVEVSPSNCHIALFVKSWEMLGDGMLTNIIHVESIHLSGLRKFFTKDYYFFLYIFIDVLDRDFSKSFAQSNTVFVTSNASLSQRAFRSLRFLLSRTSLETHWDQVKHPSGQLRHCDHTPT